jgi:Protein of unknown function (DUF998)
MTLQSITMTGAALAGTASDTPPWPVRVTRSLLGYGVIAGPFYVVVSLVQALTRDGFDLTRHAWSLLANGELGWVQVANFAVTGAMLVAFAVGLHRALAGGRGVARAAERPYQMSTASVPKRNTGAANPHQATALGGLGGIGWPR